MYVQYSYQIYVMRQAVRLDTEEYHHERLNELTPNYTGLRFTYELSAVLFFPFTDSYIIYDVYI